jgi:hypothetical protein
MIARFEGALHLVVNAGRATHDIAPSGSESDWCRHPDDRA